MRRAIDLARRGEADTSPNPMVGAVIVGTDGSIIGEGYHRRCGEGHAEVNAVASVVDRSLLKDSTMYVTLEPCSHYGKTPPCARLIIDSGIPRVVVGMTDPHDVVSGRGIAMLRQAGVEVVTGVLEDECKAINPKFIFSHTSVFPYITVKFACSSDGYLDRDRNLTEMPELFSSPVTSLMVQRLRAVHDAILVGAETLSRDNPRLDLRDWDGRSPVKVIVSRRGRISPQARVFDMGRTIVYSSVACPDLEARGATVVRIPQDSDLTAVMADLHQRGVTSVLIEGGATIINRLFELGLWNRARVEVAPYRLGDRGVAHVGLPPVPPVKVENIDCRQILTFFNLSPLKA